MPSSHTESPDQPSGEVANAAATAKLSTRLRFNRNEWSGAFGDMGTDLPLLVGMILASGMDAASVLTLFGLMQIGTAIAYRMPMPVQPLKAMAAIVIAQKLPPNILYGGGLAIGMSMLLLTATGALGWISRAVPKPVVRGIQCGLGLQLAGIALRDYVQSDGAPGLWLAGVGFLVALLLAGRKRVPAALLVIALGAVYAIVFKGHDFNLAGIVGFHLPIWHQPTAVDVWTGFLVLALPQIPLSIANSVLATRQLAEDLFPERGITAKKIGWTYSIMNLINPFFGGAPVCHGSGGMAGHYAFGGRTGGSVVIYGTMFVGLGMLFGPGFQGVIKVFPLPILGVLLLFEAVTLLALPRDLAGQKRDFVIAMLVAVICSAVPYGYLVGLITGVICYHLTRRGLVHFGE